MTEAILLRVPQDLADRLRQKIKENLDENVRVTFSDTGRNATFSIGGETREATMMDLPCITEVHRLLNKSVLVKAGDIGQVLVVHPEGESSPCRTYRSVNGVTAASRARWSRRKIIKQYHKFFPEIDRKLNDIIKEIETTGSAPKPSDLPRHTTNTSTSEMSSTPRSQETPSSSKPKGKTSRVKVAVQNIRDLPEGRTAPSPSPAHTSLSSPHNSIPPSSQRTDASPSPSYYEQSPGRTDNDGDDFMGGVDGALSSGSASIIPDEVRYQEKKLEQEIHEKETQIMNLRSTQNKGATFLELRDTHILRLEGERKRLINQLEEIRSKYR